MSNEKETSFTVKEQAEIDEFCAKYGQYEQGRKLLFRAIECGTLACVKFLLSEEDVNAKEYKEYDDSTLLHKVARLYDVAKPERNRRNIEIAKFLISQGADVNAKNKLDGTPLLEAAEWCDTELVKLLVSHGADVNIAGIGKSTPLNKAIVNNAVEIVRFLISHGADVHDKSWPPLHMAASNSDAGVARFLVSEGFDVNAKNDQGVTPLHVACDYWKTSPEVIQFLISEGANVNAQDNDGKTPLHWITRYGSASGGIEIVKFLVSKGADITKRNINGRTPLSFAKEHGNTEVVAYLSGIIVESTPNHD